MAKIESPTSAGDCLQQNIDKLRLEFDRNIKITTEVLLMILISISQ